MTSPRRPANDRTGLVTLSVFFGAAIVFFLFVVVNGLMHGRGITHEWILIALCIFIVLVLAYLWRRHHGRYRH